MGDDRAVLVAGRAPVPTEPLVEESERHPVGPLVEAGDRRLGEGRRPGRPSVGERRLGRSGRQPDRPGRVGRAARRGRPVVELERELEVGERIAGRGHRLGQRRRLDRRRPGPAPVSCAARCWRARDPGRAAEPLGQGGVMPTTLGRQEVGLHRPGDQLVAEADPGVAGQSHGIGRRERPLRAPVSRRLATTVDAQPADPTDRCSIAGEVDARRELDRHEPVLDRLDQADGQVRAEEPAAAAGRAARAGRRSVGRPLERRRCGGELVDPERLTGRGEQAQDPAALRASARRGGP